MHCTRRDTHCLHHQSCPGQLVLVNWLLIPVILLLVLDEEVVGVHWVEFEFFIVFIFWPLAMHSAASFLRMFFTFVFVDLVSVHFIFFSADLDRSLMRLCGLTVAGSASAPRVARVWGCRTPGGGTTSCGCWLA